MSTTKDTAPVHDIMRPTEVAALFGVDAKTVIRWANAGKIAAFRTLGGHRRFYRKDIEAILNTPQTP